MEKKSVLIIEDKDVVRMLMCDVLIGTGRYEVISASSGYQGLLKIVGDEHFTLPSDTERLEETVGRLTKNGLDSLPMSRRFDLVLCDLRMPGIDGIRTLKLIRRLCPEQICVLITGYRIEDCLQELEELGPNAVLHKPLKNDELVQAIDGACGGVAIPSGNG